MAQLPNKKTAPPDSSHFHSLSRRTAAGPRYIFQLWAFWQGRPGAFPPRARRPASTVSRILPPSLFITVSTSLPVRPDLEAHSQTCKALEGSNLVTSCHYLSAIPSSHINVTNYRHCTSISIYDNLPKAGHTALLRLSSFHSARAKCISISLASPFHFVSPVVRS